MTDASPAITSRRRSLAWRVAVGVFLLVAVVVVVQAAAVLWVVSRGQEGPDGLSGTTGAVGARLGPALEADPNLDVAGFLREAAPADRLFVIMRSGATFGSLPGRALTTQVVAELNRSALREVPVTWEQSVFRAAAVMVDARLAGIVGGVPPTALERYGPTVLAVVIGVVVAGTLLATAFIVRPLRRRLRSVTTAAQRLGTGDFSARASRDGADEVTDLAMAFNFMADELVARTNRLEASDEARRQLVADVSHELMTPVTTIRGYLETLAMPDVQLDAAARSRYVVTARRETLRLERLIGDLLDSARLEAGGVELTMADVEVRDLFQRVVDRHEPECLDRDIVMTSAVAPGARVVLGDAFRLEQALTNLVSNALRHSHDRGTVHLTAERSPAGVVLAVSDTGEGIASSELPLIFDRFYKVDGHRRASSSGSGLGLSIVRAIVTRHGGQVRAVSALGEGTTITIELPIPQGGAGLTAGSSSGRGARPVSVPVGREAHGA